LFGKARIEREAEKAAVPVIVDHLAQIDENLRIGIEQVLVDVDQSALLGHEDAAVVREVDAGRQGAAGDRIGAVETGRQGLRKRAGTGEKETKANSERSRAHHA